MQLTSTELMAIQTELAAAESTIENALMQLAQAMDRTETIRAKLGLSARVYRLRVEIDREGKKEESGRDGKNTDRDHER